ncbi:MAG TPA: FecR domain-containing protein [Mycobacterium sp.]|nr:FecR domain-containing protein [Mycobacterium sp.]
MHARTLFAASIVGAVVALANPASVIADSEPGAGVVTQLRGEATVARPTLPRPLALGLRDDVFIRDEIRTQERSLVHVLMGGKALLTVRELSVLKVTEDTGRVSIELQSGKIGLAVLRQRMKPGEIIEIRTPNAVAAVRGTVLVTEIVPSPAGSGASGVITHVHLLHGALDVSLRSSPGTPAVSLQTLQTLAVAGNVFRGVRALSSHEATTLTADLKPKEPDRMVLPESVTATLLAQEVQRATTVAAALIMGSSQGQGAGSRTGHEHSDTNNDTDKGDDEDKGSDKGKEKHGKHAGKDKVNEHGKRTARGQDNAPETGDGAGAGSSHKMKEGTDLAPDAGDGGPKDQGKDRGPASGLSRTTSTSGSGSAGSGGAGSASMGGSASGLGGFGGGSGSSGGSLGGSKSGGSGSGGGLGNGLTGLNNIVLPGHFKKGKDK